MKTFKVKILDHAGMRSKDWDDILEQVNEITSERGDFMFEFDVEKAEKESPVFEKRVRVVNGKLRHSIDNEWFTKTHTLDALDYHFVIGYWSLDQWLKPYKYNTLRGQSLDKRHGVSENVLTGSFKRKDRRIVTPDGKKLNEVVRRIIHELCGHSMFDHILEMPHEDKTHHWDYNQDNLLGMVSSIKSFLYENMDFLKHIEYGGKKYPVTFRQTRKYSHTGMKKKGLVHHATTSLNYNGDLGWLVDGYDPITRTYGNGGSSLFLVGRNVGEIAQLGRLNQKLWHAGRITAKTHARFKKIAVKDNQLGGKYVNPNLYLDGVEYTGGIDRDKSGKIEKDEVNLTEWQYACAQQIAKWHALANDYELTEETQLIHQDITSDKPDLTEILEEHVFRLFNKKPEKVAEEHALQTDEVARLKAENAKLRKAIEATIALVKKTLLARK